MKIGEIDMMIEGIDLMTGEIDMVTEERDLMIGEKDLRMEEMLKMIKMDGIWRQRLPEKKSNPFREIENIWM